MKTRWILPLATTVLAGACATSNPTYDPVLPLADGASVHEFAIAGDAVPEKAVGLDTPTDYSQVSTAALTNPYLVPGASAGAAAAGGLIAGLIIAGIDAQVDAMRNGRINEFLNQQHFDAKKMFYDALKTDLSAEGYVVNVADMPAPAAVATAANAKSAPAPSALAGPMLKVHIDHYGYQITSQGWAPSASASVTLVAADGTTTVLKQAVALGAPPVFLAPAAAANLSPVGGDALVMPYDQGYLFKNVDEIVGGDPALSVAAVRFALTSVAEGVARLLRPDSRASSQVKVAAVGQGS